jgi:uncharacterized membrane protein YdbT with pleckstrin-like domain
MLRLDNVIQLKEDEEVRALCRKHALTLAPGLCGALLLIVLPFFFLFPLFHVGVFGVIVFGVTVLIGLGVAYRCFALWDGDLLIVTNRRIVDVDQRGIFSRVVSEIQMDLIQDVSWAKNGIVDHLFGLGSVRMQTREASMCLTAERIPHPQSLHDLITNLRHATKPKRVDIPHERAAQLRRIEKQLESMDDHALARMEDAMKQTGRDITVKRLFGDTSASALKPIDPDA